MKIRTKIHWLNYSIVAILVGALVGAASWYLYVLDHKNHGIAYLKSKNYTEALSSFNIALSKKPGDAALADLKDLTEGCLKLQEDYNNNKFTEVLKDYEDISDDPYYTNVSVDIDSLYAAANKKPKLTIKYISGSECTALSFKSSKKLKDGGLDIVDNGGRANVVYFQVINSSVEAAEGLTVDFKFNNMVTSIEAEDNWKVVKMSDKTLGLCSELKYSLTDELLYKDIPHRVALDLNGAAIGSDANMTITLFAKDAEPKTIVIPVSIQN